MKTQLLTTLALSAALALCVATPARAQFGGKNFPVPPITWPFPTTKPCPHPPVCPTPSPSFGSYFLGVYTSTVPVENQGGIGPVAASGGYQTRVAPGYGSTVYGQRINQIVPNSPAFHAGLEPGDIILDANGTPMDSREDLIAAIQNSQGYLEMKVVDRNTGGIQWVVAQTDPQNTNPVYSTQTNRNRNGFQGGNSEASRNNRTSNPGFNPSQSPQNQGPVTLGGRRPPVRRTR